MQDQPMVSRSLRSTPRTAVRALTLGVGALGLLAGHGGAQAPPRLLVSTSSDVSAGGGIPFVDDGDMVAVSGARAPHGAFVEGHWLACTGLVPGDIDAFGFRSPGPAGRAESFAFSLLSNEGGFLDGDVLGLAPGGGIQAWVSEATLLAALGVTDNIDVDALDFDDQGRLLFSLQNDLNGTVLGLVEDGDVLRLETGGTVTRLVNEPTVGVCFSIATGLTSSIGDVLGIDWVAGELWVSVQSPSSHDGAVLSCGATPQVVVDEAGVGLGGAELDALSLLEPAAEIAGFTVSPRQLAPGAAFQAEFWGDPNSTQLVLMSGGVAQVPFSHAPGFGAWYLDPTDPWLTSFWVAPAPSLVYLDANGSYQTTYALPSAPLFAAGLGGEDGWSFQMVDLATLELSAPLRIEKL